MIFDKKANQWVNTWENRMRVSVTLDQHIKLTEFWDEMMDVAYDAAMPQEIRGPLREAMDKFPIWVPPGGIL